MLVERKSLPFYPGLMIKINNIRFIVLLETNIEIVRLVVMYIIISHFWLETCLHISIYHPWQNMFSNYLNYSESRRC